MNYRFHPEALSEFQSASTYYEAQQRGLGERYVLAVQTAIDRIIDSPLSGRILDGEVRRYLTKVFPYAVLYAVEKDYILIVAVMHCHCEPGYWQHRA